MAKLIKFAHVNAQGDFPAMLAHFGIDYQRTGDQLRLLCPFHDDTKPSLNITLTATETAQANTFHCFGCHESGSLIDFVAAVEGTTDLRAAAELIDRVSGCGLAPPRTEKRARKAKSAKPARAAKSRSEPRADESEGERSSQPKSAVTGESAPLKRSEEINPPLKFAFTLDPTHPYLTERVDPETVKLFGLGLLPETSRSMMAGRICIPVHDTAGRLIAYAGRYPQAEPPGDVPKYLLPKAFEKQAALFNLHRLPQPCKWAILVEGFFGAMRLFRLDLPAVAVMGSAVSAAQVSLLAERGVRHVVLMFDGDDAGRARAEASLPLLARSFFVKTFDLPDGAEPDTLPEAELLGLLGLKPGVTRPQSRQER